MLKYFIKKLKEPDGKKVVYDFNNSYCRTIYKLYPFGLQAKILSEIIFIRNNECSKQREHTQKDVGSSLT